jgi:hypothetical protein
METDINRSQNIFISIVMNIILTCVGKFQEYILENITQLLALGHTSIYVITDRKFFTNFGSLCLDIILIDVAELPDTYKYAAKCPMDKSFREGFWVNTSARFFYIYECMRKYRIYDVVHIENDVVIYYNVDVLEPLVDKSQIYMPFDSYSRNIASIVYIPNHQTLAYILDHYDVRRNDMYNFAKHLSSRRVDTFPIFTNKYYQNRCDERAFVSRNYTRFPYLFDAAAMGQYLGGIDPLNQSGDTRGFVNETTVIQYDKYKFVWSNHLTQTNIYQPFLYIEDIDNENTTQLLPIFNLHIHSKTVNRFTSKSSAPFYNTFFAYHSNVELLLSFDGVRTPERGVSEALATQSVGVRGFACEAGVSGWRPETPTGLSGDGLPSKDNKPSLGHTRTPTLERNSGVLANPNKTLDSCMKQSIQTIDGYPFVSTVYTNVKMFDVVVPVGPDDVIFIQKHVQYIQQNVMGFRNIYLISCDDTIRVPGSITISESIFPFSKTDISFPEVYIGDVLCNRNGWYLQQLLKMYSPFVIPGILENILVIDADTVFVRPSHFIQNNKFFYGFSNENHIPYFKHASKLHPSFTKTDPEKSGIVHYMGFQRKYLKKIMDMVEDLHKKPFWRVFLDEVDIMEGSSSSEYELYFHFMLRMFPEKIELRELTGKTVSSHDVIPIQTCDVVSCHSYARK